jgi:hypothetical protein
MGGQLHAPATLLQGDTPPPPDATVSPDPACSAIRSPPAHYMSTLIFRLRFSLSIIIHHCSTLIFIHVPTIIYLFPFLWRNSPTRARAASFLRFLEHTHLHIAVGRTPLDERSARLRNPHLTTSNTHKRQDIHSPGGIRTRNISMRSVAELSFRPFGNNYL